MNKTTCFAAISLLAVFTSCNNKNDENGKEANNNHCEIKDSTLLAEKFAKGGVGLSFSVLQTITYPIAAEDTLDLGNTSVSQSDAADEIYQSRSDITINNNQLPYIAETIGVQAINAMCESASTLAASSCSHSLTALRVIYAIANNSLKLYYRPIKFCAVGEAQQQGGITVTNYMATEDESKLYSYTTGNTRFDELTAAQLNQANQNIAAYQNSGGGALKLRYKNGDLDLGNFVNDTTRSGSVKSVIFPFQELLNYADNASYVYFYNAISRVDQNNYQLNKHILIITNKDIRTGEYINTSSAILGNMTHLCPPSCGTAKAYQFVLK